MMGRPEVGSQLMHPYCNILERLFDIATAMAATPFQADRQNAANTQKILRARQSVENREEERCVYSIPLSDLIGKLLRNAILRDQRQCIDIIDSPCSGRMKTFLYKTFVHE